MKTILVTSKLIDTLYYDDYKEIIYDGVKFVKSLGLKFEEDFGFSYMPERWHLWTTEDEADFYDSLTTWFNQNFDIKYSPQIPY